MGEASSLSSSVVKGCLVFFGKLGHWEEFRCALRCCRGHPNLGSPLLPPAEEACAHCLSHHSAWPGGCFSIPTSLLHSCPYTTCPDPPAWPYLPRPAGLPSAQCQVNMRSVGGSLGPRVEVPPLLNPAVPHNRALACPKLSGVYLHSPIFSCFLLPHLWPFH